MMNINTLEKQLIAIDYCKITLYGALNLRVMMDDTWKIP